MLTIYKNSKTEQDLFLNLPPEIMIDILLRLPIITIGRYKCVCKSWLHLIRTRDFVSSHVSNSSPVLLAHFEHKRSSKLYKILETVGTQDSGHHCNVVFSFDFPHRKQLSGSINGLLFLHDSVFRNIFICNPITREYIKLAPPKEVSSSKLIAHVDNYGFGVSKVSSQYKVVRMFYESWMNGDVRDISPCKCEVYTLGTGSWRRVRASGPPKTTCSYLFFNGNLHWLVYDWKQSNYDPQWIRCFDLETECVSTFSAPYFVHGSRRLCGLGDNGLCVCDISGDDIVIWLMNEYGDDKSWTKELVIKSHAPLSIYGALVLPIKIFDDGDILFAIHYTSKLSYYSSKTKTCREIDVGELFVERSTLPVIYTPSFLSLKTFTMENVSSF